MTQRCSGYLWAYSMDPYSSRKWSYGSITPALCSFSCSCYLAAMWLPCSYVATYVYNSIYIYTSTHTSIQLTEACCLCVFDGLGLHYENIQLACDRNILAILNPWHFTYALISRIYLDIVQGTGEDNSSRHKTKGNSSCFVRRVPKTIHGRGTFVLEASKAHHKMKKMMMMTMMMMMTTMMMMFV